jgi:hypothetical protein
MNPTVKKRITIAALSVGAIVSVYFAYVIISGMTRPDPAVERARCNSEVIQGLRDPSECE